ncbi:MAG: hypothetical protein QOD03_1135 [Verrucomicrobiota bacterium]|jgi:hypothetical protein
MTAAFSKLKAHLGTWHEWELNPIVIKELRQSMRSNFLTGTLLLLLSVLFLAFVACLAGQNLLVGVTQRAGLNISRALLAILTIGSLIFVPVFTGLRMAGERQEGALDLMFITTLAPLQIVRGKLVSGAYLAMMFFSAGAPFMALTNQLRGVDLPTIFFVLTCLYAVVCLAIQAAILFGCLPLHAALKLFIGVLFIIGLVVVAFGLITFFSIMLQSGVGSMMGKLSFWIGFFMLMVLVFIGILLMQAIAVSLMNTDSRPRGYFNEVIRNELS